MPPPQPDAPAVDLATTRRIGIVMFAGAIFGLVCAIVGPDPDPSDHAAFGVIIGLELASLAVLVARRRMTLGLLRLSGYWGVVTTCLCVAVARPTNGVPLYTIWPVLVAAYSLPRRDFIGLLGTALVGVGIAIGGFVPPPARLTLWVDTALTVGFTALVVRYLRESLDALILRLQDVAGRLRETARRDPLTGLPNRRAFEEGLARELERAARAGRDLALVLFDLDHFKQVNDVHGHAQGDASLRAFAAVARQELGPGDLLARMGGEEFALALFGADAAQGREVAERIAGRLRAATADGPARLTVSAGVVEHTGAAPSGEALLDAADRALYVAKHAGRRRVAVATGTAVTVGGEVPPLPASREPAPCAPPEPPSTHDLEIGIRRHEDDRRIMRRVAIFQCAAAVPAMASSLLLPDPSGWDVAVTAVLCAVLALGAGALALVRHAPMWAMRALPFGGVAVIATAVAINDPISGTPFFFLWPAVFAAYFFDRRHLTRVLVAISVTYGAVLALWVDAPLRTSDFTTVMVPVVVAAAGVHVLRSRVRGLVDELHRKLAELQEAASRDALTGVLNRRAFDGLLDRETRRARESGLELSLVMFDVDHFKQVNDRFGHAAGDEALRVVAQALETARRSGDLVARLGGEEFAMVLLGADAEAAAEVADRVGAALAERTAGARAALSMSAGVAQVGFEIVTTDQLRLAADRALYAAKGAGRARTAVWGASVAVRPAASAPPALTGA